MSSPVTVTELIIVIVFIVNEFYEGSDAILVLNGNLIVQHDDHPSYLLQELIVDLVHADSDYESLSLNISNQSIYTVCYCIAYCHSFILNGCYF